MWLLLKAEIVCSLCKRREGIFTKTVHRVTVAGWWIGNRLQANYQADSNLALKWSQWRSCPLYSLRYFQFHLSSCLLSSLSGDVRGDKLIWPRLFFLRVKEAIESSPGWQTNTALLPVDFFADPSILSAPLFTNSVLSNPAKLHISSLHLFFRLFYHPFDTCTEGVKWSHLSVCQNERSLASKGERAGWEEGHLKVIKTSPGTHLGIFKKSFKKNNCLD